MKFSLINSPQCKVQNKYHYDIEEAYSGMLSAYADLTDAQQNIVDACNIMDNVKMSMNFLRTSNDAIKCLNFDGSLEALCNCEAKLLTVDKSQEALSDALGKAWESFKEWLKKFIASIKKFFANLFSFSKQKEEDIKEVNNSSTEEVASALNSCISSMSQARADSDTTTAWRQSLTKADRILKVIDDIIHAETSTEDKLTELQKLKDELRVIMEEFAKVAFESRDSASNKELIDNLISRAKQMFSLVARRIAEVSLIIEQTSDLEINFQEVLKDAESITESLKQTIATENDQINIAIYNQTADNLKKRCSSKKLAAYNAHNSGFQEYVIKFNSSIEAKLNDAQDMASANTELISVLHQLNGLVAKLDSMGARVIKASTTITSKVAKKLSK